ncbi:hypothetical protein CASFOL_033206 [Castilleja foliolosa]|uniref:Carboxypeptidase n=1 Tax=Castilleja foliolosa TaxID=1961234 RepID=A0ABD3C0M8_9LAMI
MDKSLVVFSLVVSVLVLVFPIKFNIGLMVNAEGTNIGSQFQIWNYVQVRPAMGSSGVGIGNFQEIGPLDTYLRPRNSTWLQIADLLFVDSPVGTGYSYVKNESFLVKSDEEAADDLITLLIKVFNNNENLQKSPLYIVGESYGGKHAVALGLAVVGAIKDRKLKLKLGGVVLGNSWISPEDYTSSWGPLLNDVSRLDNNCLHHSNMLANQIKQALKDDDSLKAIDKYTELGQFISDNSNGVNFYNFLLDYWIDPLNSSLESSQSQNSGVKQLDGNITTLMNGEIKKMLKIIPQNIT